MESLFSQPPIWVDHSSPLILLSMDNSEQPSGGAFPKSKSGLAAASLAASFKLDEGYSDDTKSQPENEAAVSQSEEAMLLPQWIFSHPEAERAGTYSL